MIVILYSKPGIGSIAVQKILWDDLPDRVGLYGMYIVNNPKKVLKTA